jgi:hypothetical protein
MDNSNNTRASVGFEGRRDYPKLPDFGAISYSLESLPERAGGEEVVPVD